MGDRRTDALTRNARASVAFLRAAARPANPSNHDIFIADLIEELCRRLDIARSYRHEGEVCDDTDLVRQLEQAGREIDSSLHEMAALRLRTALERAGESSAPPPSLSALGITCTEGVEYLRFYGADPNRNDFRVHKDSDWIRVRACIDEAERRSLEGWKVVRS